jgi:hypothetical protein
MFSPSPRLLKSLACSLCHSLTAARSEVRHQAAIIAEISDELHADGTDATPEGAAAIAAELVASVLLPEVERQLVRDSTKRHQRRFVEAAHKVVPASWALFLFFVSVFSLFCILSACCC